jgi:hypothetical protein
MQHESAVTDTITNNPQSLLRVCRYGGGRAGLSDTMAGTFWVLDALCEMAKAGAAGFHLHWGIGGAPDGTMGQPNTGVQTNFFYQVGDERLDYTELKPRGVSVFDLNTKQYGCSTGCCS